MILPRLRAACLVATVLLPVNLSVAQPPDESQPASSSFDAVKSLIEAQKTIVRDTTAATSKRLRALSEIGVIVAQYNDIGGDVKAVEDLRKDAIHFVFTYLDPALGGRTLSYAAADVVYSLQMHSVPLLVKSMGSNAAANVTAGLWQLTAGGSTVSFSDVLVIRRLVASMRDHAKEQNTDNADKKQLLDTIVNLNKVIVVTGRQTPLYPMPIRNDAFEGIRFMTRAAKEEDISDGDTLEKVINALVEIASSLTAGGHFRHSAAEALASEVVASGLLEAEQKALVKHLLDLSDGMPHVDQFVQRVAAKALGNLAKDGEVAIPEGKRDEYITGLFKLVANPYAPVRVSAAATIGEVAKAKLSEGERIDLKDRLLGALGGAIQADVQALISRALRNLAERTNQDATARRDLAAAKTALEAAKKKVAAAEAKSNAATVAKTAAAAAHKAANDTLTAATGNGTATDEMRQAVKDAKAALDKATSDENTAKAELEEEQDAQKALEDTIKALEAQLAGGPAAPSAETNGSQTASNQNGGTQTQHHVIFVTGPSVHRASQLTLASSRSRASQTVTNTQGLRKRTLPEAELAGLRKVVSIPKNQQAGRRDFREGLDDVTAEIEDLPNSSLGATRQLRSGGAAGAITPPDPQNGN